MACNFSFSQKKKKVNQKATVGASRGNWFKFLNYLMEQKCFMRLFREREGQMSLINADLLRGLGSGKGRQSSCLSQCTRVLVWDPGWDGWLDPQQRIGVVGLLAEGTVGCRLLCTKPREDPACTCTVEKQHSSLSSCSSLEISWLSEEKSRS